MKKKIRSFLDIHNLRDSYYSSASDEDGSSLASSSPSATSEQDDTQDIKSSSAGRGTLRRALSWRFSWGKAKRKDRNSNLDGLKTVETCRLFVIGYPSVGKTAAVVRFLTGRYIHEYQSREEESYTREVDLDGRNVTVQLTSMTYKTKIHEEKFRYGYTGILLVFSVVEMMSFYYVQNILNEIRAITSTPIVVVGTKIDLSDRRCIKKDIAEKIAEAKDCSYFEISSADNIGVHDCFNYLLRQIFQHNNDSVSLDSSGNAGEETRQRSTSAT